MQNEQIITEDTGFLNNKEFQIKIRKDWRAYCKAQPKSQTLTDMAYYHILRFGNTKKCFTPLTSESKINNHYSKDAMHTAKECKRDMQYSLEYYIKNNTRAPLSITNIWGEEMLKSYAGEILEVIKAWDASEYKPRPVIVKKEKKEYVRSDKKEMIHA